MASFFALRKHLVSTEVKYTNNSIIRAINFNIKH